jgi:hypothetical protein
MNPPTQLNHALNIAFVIGLSLVTLSLVDFILTKGQKEWVEGYIYRASQRVIDVRMISWLRWWMQTSRRAHIVEASLGIIMALGWLAILGLAGYALWTDLSWSTLWMLLLLLFAWGITGSIFDKVFDTVGKGALQLLAECETVGAFVVAYIIIEIVGLIALGLWIGFVYWWAGPDKLDAGQVPAFIKYLGNWVAAFALIWVLTFIDGALTLIGALVVTCLKLIMYLVQLLTWRIIVFPKGPLAAIVLLATATLGILKIFLPK